MSYKKVLVDNLICRDKEIKPKNRRENIKEALIKQNYDITDKSIGIYRWWAKKEELEELLEKYKKDLSFIKKMYKENGYYCIYIGIAKKSLLKRLDWHINDKHKDKQVKSRRLSTLRQSISSLIGKNQFDQEETDKFMKKLYFSIDIEEKDLEKKEKENIDEYVSLLNIVHNKRPEIKDFKSFLIDRRTNARYRSEK